MFGGQRSHFSAASISSIAIVKLCLRTTYLFIYHLECMLFYASFYASHISLVPVMILGVFAPHNF